jgi:hypothetical protein
MKRQVVFGSFGSVFVITSCIFISTLRAAGENEDKAISALVEAAQAALETTDAAHQAGQASVEDVYQWSQRLMKAELKAGAGEAAIKDHLARMKNLYDKTDALYQTGSQGGSARNFRSCKYYLLEAEAMKAPE